MLKDKIEKKINLKKNKKRFESTWASISNPLQLAYPEL
jgi:hypothetical protein